MELVPAQELTEAKLRTLAREIAADIFDPERIMSNLGITQWQWDYHARTPQFQQMISEARDALNSVTGTYARNELKANALIEEVGLPVLHDIMKNTRSNDAARIDAVKLAAKIAKLGERDNNMVHEGGKLIVEINMGADTKLKFEQEGVTPQGNVIEGEVVDASAS